MKSFVYAYGSRVMLPRLVSRCLLPEAISCLGDGILSDRQAAHCLVGCKIVVFRSVFTQ